MDDQIFFVGLLMSGLVGGFIAWKYATWNLYRRPGAQWATDEIHPDRINRRLLARRKRQRLQTTAMAMIMSPILVYAFLKLIGAVMESAYVR